MLKLNFKSAVASQIRNKQNLNFNENDDSFLSLVGIYKLLSINFPNYITNYVYNNNL